MMHERRYTPLFNLNGYESTTTKIFSLSASIPAKKWQEKITLNILTTEMKNKEARKCVRDTPIKERSGKKNVDLGF